MVNEHIEIKADEFYRVGPNGPPPRAATDTTQPVQPGVQRTAVQAGELQEILGARRVTALP
jgi:hypothetical protein